jgi:hypothetical protein
METKNQLIQVLTTAISPVVLISGVGLLVLSMTNRFGQTTGRARTLVARRLAATDEAHRVRLDTQIRILYRRARILMIAICLALVSVLLAAVLIMTLFVHFLGAADLRVLAVVVFVLSLLSLMASLVLFIQDMTLSLKALREVHPDQL